MELWSFPNEKRRKDSLKVKGKVTHMEFFVEAEVSGDLGLGLSPKNTE